MLYCVVHTRLVSTKRFKTVNLFFLIVGHTHEDIDQLFAVMMHIFCEKGSFQTPEEMLTHLNKALLQKAEAKNLALCCSHLRAVRDFEAWLTGFERKVEHCFGNRHGIEAPHAFSYKLRADLGCKDLAAGVVESGCQEDVMCCVKTYMWLGQQYVVLCGYMLQCQGLCMLLWLLWQSPASMCVRVQSESVWHCARVCVCMRETSGGCYLLNKSK